MIKSFGPMTSSGRIIYFVKHEKTWMVQAGCYWDTIDNLIDKVKGDKQRQDYLAICQLVKNL